MSVVNLKNNLHQMVEETEDPEILAQIANRFASLLGGKDAGRGLLYEEKERMELGKVDSETGRTIHYFQIREKAKDILGSL